MKRLKKISAFICMVMVVGLMTGCTTFDNFKETFFSSENIDETIKIGVFEPQTGMDKDYGQLEIMGFELANEMYPSVLGKDVELIYEDTQSNIYTAESAIQNLITYKPSVILGTYGEANALVSSDYIEEAEIPAIAITNKNSLITYNNDYYFRMAFMDATQGNALANYAKYGLKAKKIAIFRQKNDDSTAEVTNKFIARINSLYKTKAIVTKQAYKIEEVDYTEYLQNIKDSGADAIFAPVSTIVADQLFTQAERMNLQNVTFIGTTQWYSEEFLTMMKKHPRIQAMVTSDFNKLEATTKMSKTFIKMFKDKYGQDAEPEEATALAFDAYVLTINSIEKVGSADCREIRDALAATKNFEGASGNISFNSIGDPIKTIIVNKVADGQYTPIYTDEK